MYLQQAHSAQKPPQFVMEHFIMESFGLKIEHLRLVSGNGLRVKTQRVKTHENLSEESNLPRRLRRYPEIL